MKKLIQQIENEFNSRFGNDYALIKSPGRVNLIGEHTDYNDGLVLPAAVDKSIFLAIGKNDSDEGRFYAVDKAEYYETDITGTLSKSGKGWPDYLLGVVDQLRKNGYDVEGFDCVFGGNVPMGAGISSSAALEGGVLFGLAEIFNWDILPMEMAKIAQKAENDFVGVQCGIMDQFVNIHGKEGFALKLDCRSLEFELYPFRGSDIQIILCNTGVRRDLADSEYNIRRQQCEEGVKLIQAHNPEIKNLRDIDISMLNKHQDELDPLVYKRCKFVIEENERVKTACEDLTDNDFESFGQRMFSSHYGLRHMFEVSCHELDTLVGIAKKIKGVLGARMMGGGFGGCTINLVKKNAVKTFIRETRKSYREEIGDGLEIYQVSLSDGTKHIPRKSILKQAHSKT